MLVSCSLREKKKKERKERQHFESNPEIEKKMEIKKKQQQQRPIQRAPKRNIIGALSGHPYGLRK